MSAEAIVTGRERAVKRAGVVQRVLARFDHRSGMPEVRTHHLPDGSVLEVHGEYPLYKNLGDGYVVDNQVAISAYPLSVVHREVDGELIYRRRLDQHIDDIRKMDPPEHSRYKVLFKAQNSTVLPFSPGKKGEEK